MREYLLWKRDPDPAPSVFRKIFQGVNKKAGRAARNPRRLRHNQELRDIADASMRSCTALMAEA